MSEPTEEDFQAFEEDLKFLIQTLKDSFESTDVEFYIDEQNDILYVKLEGLND